jgi:hypothetical protein
MSLIDIDWKPTDRKLRQFAAIFAAGCLLLGAVVVWRIAPALEWEPRAAAFWVWMVGATVGLVGLALPKLVRPIYLLWMGVAMPIGWVVSHVLLAVLFFGVFTLVGALLRLRGWDPLHMRRKSGVDSYWRPRGGERKTEDYFRQF